MPSFHTGVLPLILLLLLAASLTALSSASPEIRILSAEKRIDLTSSIVRVFLTLKVENSGSSDASSVLLAFPPTEADRLSILKAALAGGKRKKKTYNPLEVSPTEVPDTPNRAKLFSVSLAAPLKAGGTTTLEMLYVLTHSLEPFPAEISQSESQLVYYRDSATLLSPYHVVEQIAFIKMPSNRVESFTRVDPTNRAGGELKYGYAGSQLCDTWSCDVGRCWIFVMLLQHLKKNLVGNPREIPRGIIS